METNGNNNLSRKTKAQLQDELTDCLNALEKTQNKLSEKQNQLAEVNLNLKELEEKQLQLSSTERELERLQGNIDSANEECKAFKQENEKLLSQIEKFTRKVTDKDKKIQNLEDEIEQNKQSHSNEIQLLKQKIVAVDTTSSEEKSQEEEINALSAPKQKFRIEITPNDESFRTVIFHLLSKDQKVINGLNKEDIFRFIMKYLPKTEEVTTEIKTETEQQKVVETVDQVKPNIEATKPKLAHPRNKKHTTVIQNIQIQQHDQFINESGELRPYLPFSVNARLRLPVVPTEQNIDIDTPLYGLYITVKEIGRDEPIIVRDIYEDIKIGQIEYENDIPFPELDEGKYMINMNATIPFAHVMDQRSMEIDVRELI